MQSSLQSTRCSCVGPYRTVSSSSRSLVRRGDAMLPNRNRSGRLHVSAVASIERTLKTVSSENLTEEELQKLLQRPRIDFTSILSTVSPQLLLLLLLGSESG